MFIETERLILRTWKDEDALPYFKINQDRKVIEFLPGSLTIDQVNDFISKTLIIRKNLAIHCWLLRRKNQAN